MSNGKEMPSYESVMKQIEVLLTDGVRPRHSEMAPVEQVRDSKEVVQRLPIAVPEYLQVSSNFVFGRKSKSELEGCHPILIEVATLALKHTMQDFMVHDGLRTVAEQRRHVANGASTTMNSKHLPQSDGFSHAMDLVPIIGGVPQWDWDGCYRIACAVDFAATELGYADKIRWGGAWDRTLADFGGDPGEYRKAVNDFASIRKGQGRRVFLDGPHYELIGV